MELRLFSKYRTTLMGLATVLIIVFHGLSVRRYYDVNIPISLRLIKGFFGSVGVDIFLMISGIGIFYSMKNNTSIIDFYKRRLKRLIPSVIVVCGTFWTVRDIIIEKKGLCDFFLDVTGASFWINGENRFWYVHLIVLLYAISPLIIKLSENKKRIILLCVIIMPFLVEKMAGRFFVNAEIALCRIPIYVSGIIIGGG